LPAKGVRIRIGHKHEKGHATSRQRIPDEQEKKKKNRESIDRIARLAGEGNEGIKPKKERKGGGRGPAPEDKG